MRYRRAYLPGGTYFFTVNLLERNKSLLTDNIELLKQSMRQVKRTHPFRIDALVVLPDHLHTLWTLPAGDADFSMRWRLIKSAFSRGLPQTETIGPSRYTKAERGIWQRRFWEHLIRDDSDLAHHMAYIHFNPVKHAYVDRPIAWPYSSIHKFIRDGIMDADWGWSDDHPTSQ